jgi:hypothetical protein
MNARPLEIISSDEMYRKGEIDEAEYTGSQFHDKIILRFETLTEATQFAGSFMLDHYVPKYDLQSALEETRRCGRLTDQRLDFPIAKSGPKEDSVGEALLTAMGLSPQRIDRETWLVIPRMRFNEVQEYIDKITEQFN